LKVVLDTNVIVSGFLKPRSKPARILRLVLQGEVTIVCNEAILAEYTEVLARPKFELNRDKVEKIVQLIRSQGIHSPALAQPLNLPDPHDEPFLEAAFATGADVLVTGNIKHFPEKACKGLKVVSPAEFLQFLNPDRTSSGTHLTQ
jgi:uncharacterized protein